MTLLPPLSALVSLAYDEKYLTSIAQHLTNNAGREIWNETLKPQVKLVEPQLLKAKKRGKRAGVKTKLKSLKSRTAFPGIILTNAQSVLHKLDEQNGKVSFKAQSLPQHYFLYSSMIF